MALDDTNVLHNARGVPLAFWQWWTDELKSMLPGPWRGRVRLKTPYLRLTVGREACVLEACVRSGTDEIRRVGADAEAALDALAERRYRNWPIVLRLDQRLGLRKIIDLPAAARGDLDGLLHYELDRLTPFAADEVCFAWRIVEEDRKAGRVHVRVDLAPKAVVEDIVLGLRQRGRVVARIELDGADADESLDLTPRAPAKLEKPPRWRRLLPVLVIGLAMLMVAIPFRQQRIAIKQIEAEIARVEPAALESAALREQLDHLAGRSHLLAEIKARYLPRTNIMTALTRLVPDQAYITRLQMREEDIVLVGHADRASDLIGALEQSPLFTSPQFQSPLTRDPRSGKERFQIAVELRADQP